MNSKELVPFGSFIKHHGLNGELKVFLYNENSKTLVPGISIWLKDGNEFIPYELESIRGSKNNLLVKLKNINSRESSQFLIKKEIYGFKNYKILYGGSVKSSNCKEILALENVDGILVGSASVDIEEFNKIITS